MTNEQIDLAIQMHEQGMSWYVIATYFRTTYKTLKRRIKNYEQTIV